MIFKSLKSFLPRLRLHLLSPSPKPFRLSFYFTISLVMVLSLVSAGQFCSGNTLAQSTSNYVKNGTFDQGMAYWEGQDATIVPDPDQRKNRVIRVRLVNGVFALSQKISIPVNVKSVSGSLRVRSAEASTNKPVQIRLRLYHQNGDSMVIGGKSIQRNGVWTQIRIPAFQVNPPNFKQLLIESNRGQGFVLIDDIVLH